MMVPLTFEFDGDGDGESEVDMMWTMLSDGAVEFRGKLGGRAADAKSHHNMVFWLGMAEYKCSGAGPPGQLCVLYDGGGVRFPKRQSSKYVQQQYTLQGFR